ncbi:hypothetical protein ACQY0O_008140 [Thecaphora frezii]
MSDFVGLEAYDGPEEDRRDWMISQLQQKLQGLDDPSMGLFDPDKVSKLERFKAKAWMRFASDAQRQMVFNIIMQKMLQLSMPMELMDRIFVLQKRSTNEKELGSLIQLGNYLATRHKETLPTPLGYAWQQSPSASVFDLNKYRIFLSRAKQLRNHYGVYRVVGLSKDPNPKEKLFLGEFMAPRKADRYIPSG